MSGTYTYRGKGLCLLRLHTALELLTEQKLPITLTFSQVHCDLVELVACLNHVYSTTIQHNIYLFVFKTSLAMPYKGELLAYLSPFDLVSTL